MSFFFELLLTAFFSLLISSLLAKLFSSSSSSTSCSHGAADVIPRGTHLSEKEKTEREEVQEEEEKIIEVDETGEGFSCSEDKKEVLDDSEVEFEKEKVDDGETILEKELCVIEFGDGKIVQNQLMEEHSLVADSYNLIFGEDQSGVIKQEHLLGEIEVQVNDPVKVKVEKDNICEVEGPTSKMVFETVDAQNSLLLQEESLENPKASDEFEKARDLRDKLSDPVTEKDEKDDICEVEGLTSKIILENADNQNSSSWHDNLSELEGPANKIPQPEENIAEALVLKEEDQEKNLPKTAGPECKIPQQEESLVISKTINEDNLGELEGPASEIPQQEENITEEQEKNLSKTEGPTCKTTPLEEKETAFDEEEEWEGIERSETEERFSVAANYATNDVVSKLSDDVQLNLYGLHKVATEGPCYESSPMAIRASTRAKWHAWQRLGNMNPEMAMEQYMSLLSQNVPDWDCQPPNIENIEENERERSSAELKTYHAYDQVTNESDEGLNLTVSVSESPNKGN